MKVQQHGGNIYEFERIKDFSTNINPFGAPKGVIDAMKQSLNDISHYPDIECRKLRVKLAEKLKEEVSHIICGNGAADLIFSLVLALKPRKALLQAPTFLEYERALEAVDCKWEKYSALQLDDNLLSRITADIDILFLCNPNNPTGLLIEPVLMNKIIKKCKEHRIFLIVDECFLDFVEEEGEYTVMPFLKDHRNIFVLKAFTKLYGIPGVRLGYGICHNVELLKKLKKMTQPWNVSTIAQSAGIAALDEEKFVRKSIQYIKEERVFLKEQLKSLGYQVYDGRANYLLFRGPKNLYETCIKEGYLIRDCSNYEGLEKGYYRIAIKKREESLELIHRLKEIEHRRNSLWQKQL